MKCPKCHYLGYETGDRCRNCGYDFSLLAGGAAPVSDLQLRSDASGAEPDLDLNIESPGAIDDPIEDAGLAAAPAVASAAAPETPLPLFSRVASTDDEPLIKASAAPRRPIAVRRTPEPRGRPSPREVRALRDRSSLDEMVEQRPGMQSARVTPRHHPTARPAVEQVCEARPRAVAAAIDVAVLAGIDMVVLYLTLRMAALTMDDWQVLPVVPLLVFLGLVKFGYLTAFAAVGGQSIGKMATHVRVVTDEGAVLTPTRAIQRSLAAMVSFATLGAAFLPALMGRRLALHDRVARTRVVDVRPA